jgi:hypothetical protein
MRSIVKVGGALAISLSKLMPLRGSGQGVWWPRLLVWGVLLGGGCARAPLPDALPEAALGFLDPAQVRSETVAPGLVYHAVESVERAWSLHLLAVSLDSCTMGFRVVGLAPRGGDRQTVATLLQASGGLAAVNGDFFTPENHPLGIEASYGEVKGGSSRPVFAWRPESGPRLAPIAWRGDTLQIEEGWSLVRGAPDGRTEILAGFPALLTGGAVIGDLEGEARPAFALARHPRTGLGIDTDRNRLWLVVVDGRRDGIAEGMTLPELATLFQALGATEALNLDGGGSSTMVVRGRVVNRPSDPLGARPVVNALTVLEDASFCHTF